MMSRTECSTPWKTIGSGARASFPSIWAMPDRAFSYRQGEQIAEAFNRHQVEYLFIGKSGAIFHGYPDTTQDADLFPEKSPQNGRRIAAALRELGFPIEEELEGE